MNFLRPIALVLLAAVWGCEHAPALLPQDGPRANEAEAAHVLRRIAEVETAWKDNDLDGNRHADYWTRDVTGLFARDSTENAGKRGVSREVALADPVGVPYYAKELKGMKPGPWRGYRFKALLMDDREWPYNLDEDGDGVNDTNATRFGFVAAPEHYETDGKYTFLVNEKGIIWEKDLGGTLPPHAMPANPEAEGWHARERVGSRGGVYEAKEGRR